MIKVGVIGCGTIANAAHIPSYMKNADVEIKYFCDIIPERGVISPSDAQLMISATSPAALAVPVTESVKDAMRARILRSMLLSIAQRRKEASAP